MVDLEFLFSGKKYEKNHKIPFEHLKKSMLDQTLEGVPQKLRLPRSSEFKIEKGVAGVIFEPRPLNFVQILIF